MNATIAQALPSATPATVSDADLVGRARALHSDLRKRIKETDAARRLADDTYALMYDAGLLKLMAPRRYGGYQTSLDTFADVMRELGRADGSAAWVACLGNVCAYMVSMLFPESVHARVFTDPRGPRISGVLAPRKCKTRRVAGGYVIEEGQWGWNSGVYHADWDLLAIPLVNAAGDVTAPGFALIPTGQLEIHDDWFTIGMRGTGSTAVAAREVFVAEEWVASVPDTLQGRYGSTHLRDEMLYRTAFVPVAAIVLAYPAIGMARGALEFFMEKLPSRAIAYTSYTQQSTATVTHLALGEASAKIDCADLLMRRANADIERWARAGDELMDLHNRARVRLDAAYAIRLCYEAVDLLASNAGGSFAAENNLLNRFWRDLRTISLHGVACANTNLEIYGRVLCGLEPISDMV